ncbi:hypothetical protein AWM70_07585 [Paenibacillus yonginensis]|uniref:Nitrate reductase n=1 Tax=Paenibacillus yonginensis TaxID=1462996 RepID=A0A1B1MZ57_9BACL|nr:nucleotidyltransferase family protein [Paenibacillus yonginensis]ANS74461.1 hypothetical protein AWM70_07585 [Paenibacillus yonginensis]
MSRVESRFKQYLLENDDLLRDLRLVKELQLPQSYIAAGYIRNYIWDRLHGFDYRGRHSDIDVIYYDPSDISEDKDTRLELEIKQLTGNPKWSVKNQARMHLRNGEPPYSSTWEAMRRWPETATAVGARMDEEDQLQWICPYGLKDLLELIVRRSPLYLDRDDYLQRIRKKDWKKAWPLLNVIED